MASNGEEIELKAGFLLKSPPIKSPDETTMKKWRKRWFFLTASTLSYSSDREKKDVKGTIKLADVSVVKHFVTSNKHKHVFSLTYNVAGAGQRNLFLEGLTEEDRMSWADAVSKVTCDATDGNAVVIKIRQSVTGKEKRSSISSAKTEGIYMSGSELWITYRCILFLPVKVQLVHADQNHLHVESTQLHTLAYKWSLTEALSNFSWHGNSMASRLHARFIIFEQVLLLMFSSLKFRMPLHCSVIAGSDDDDDGDDADDEDGDEIDDGMGMAFHHLSLSFIIRYSHPKPHKG